MYSFKNKKQKEVYNILTTTIVSNKDFDGIKMIDGVIYSGQKYVNSTDSDMSDFTIGFYEILYKDILDKEILNNRGELSDNDFAGDTMNSFNTVAKKAVGLDKRKNPNDWPPYLVEFNSKYHSLCNFWLVPMEIGRTGGVKHPMSKMQACKDYVDRFLKVYSNKIEDYNKKYPNYFSKFEDFNEFAKINFLEDSYVSNGQIISFSEGRGEKIINKMIELMENRAYRIVTSEYCDELYDYFKKYGLIK